MSRTHAWGYFLLLGGPLLLFSGWLQQESESASINLERFETFSQGHSPGPIEPVYKYFLRTKKLALPGDVVLPAVPKDSGVKSWAIQPDTTVLIQLDGRVDGRVVQLRYVPVVLGATAISYECLSTTSPFLVGKFCHAQSLLTIEEIPAQLAKNEQVLKNLPAVVTAAGD